MRLIFKPVIRMSRCTDSSNDCNCLSMRPYGVWLLRFCSFSRSGVWRHTELRSTSVCGRRVYNGVCAHFATYSRVDGSEADDKRTMWMWRHRRRSNVLKCDSSFRAWHEHIMIVNRRAIEAVRHMSRIAQRYVITQPWRHHGLNRKTYCRRCWTWFIMSEMLWSYLCWATIPERLTVLRA